MKKIFAISLLLMGCGRHADRIALKSETLPATGLATLLSFNDKVVPEMRTASIVVYPNPEELVGFALEPANDDWLEVMGESSKIPKGFSAELDGDSKVRIATRIVLEVSKARDRFYLEAQSLERQLDVKDKEVKALVRAVTKAYPCYAKKTPEGAKFCVREVQEGVKPEIATDCKKLKSFPFQFETEERELFEREVNDCNAQVDAYRAHRQQVKSGQIGPLMDKRKKAKGLVTDMLKQMETFNQERYLLTLSATAPEENDVNNPDVYTVLELNEDKTALTRLDMYMDSGDGFKMYNLQNGGIKNLKYELHPTGVRALEFVIDAGEFYVDAKLSESVRDIFGLRYVGNITYHAPERGIVRKGVMKLEFDLNP